MATPRYFDVTDSISLTDDNGCQWLYQATMGFAEDRKTPTIQSGLISFFLMTDGVGDILCLYEDGSWTKDVDVFEDPMSDLARTAFLGKWNRRNSNHGFIGSGITHDARGRVKETNGEVSGRRGRI